MKQRILFVDDDDVMRLVYSDFFKNVGFKTYDAVHSEEAFEVLSTTSIDVVITDNNRPGISGLEFTKLAKEKYDIEVIILTGYWQGCSYEEAQKAGAFKLLYKPQKLEVLLDSAKEILKNKSSTTRMATSKSPTCGHPKIPHL